jgi:transcriptional regulator with XRE-family HTH domain
VNLTIDRASLKARRLMAGLTQTQLAAKIGVHPITMVRYESGSMNPRPDNVARLARALGCEIADIAAVTTHEQPAANAVGS